MMPIGIRFQKYRFVLHQGLYRCAVALWIKFYNCTQNTTQLLLKWLESVKKRQAAVFTPPHTHTAVQLYPLVSMNVSCVHTTEIVTLAQLPVASSSPLTSAHRAAGLISHHIKSLIWTGSNRNRIIGPDFSLLLLNGCVTAETWKNSQEELRRIINHAQACPEIQDILFILSRFGTFWRNKGENITACTVYQELSDV